MTVVSLTKKLRERALAELEVRNISTDREHDTTLSNSYTRVLGVLESPDFFAPLEVPVEAVLPNGNTVRSTTKKAIVREDTGALVSIVGSNYRVVSNSEIFSEFDRALTESEIDLAGAYKTVHECRGGAQTIMGYSFPAYETTITDRAVGDTIRLQVTAKNGYDGFSMFEAGFGSVRLVCMNSMVSVRDISYFAGKHTQNLVIEHAVEKIHRAIDVYCEHQEIYKRWANTNVSDRDAEKLFQKLCIKKGYKTEFNERRVEEHMDQWVRECSVLGKNRWALYNTLTWWATHASVQARVAEAGNAPIRQLQREQELRTFLTKHTNWFAEAA